METTLTQTFFNEEFGELRTVQINEEIWFYAVDACYILDIKNSRDAVSRLDDDEKMTVGNSDSHSGKRGGSQSEKMTVGNPDSHSGKRGGAQSFNIVNEAGLYRLIFQSRKPNAKKFQRWIFHEVIPQIRKTGGYFVNNSINPFPPELSERWAKIKGAEILVKAAKLTSSSKFREHLINQAHSMITGTEFIEEEQFDNSDIEI